MILNAPSGITVQKQGMTDRLCAIGAPLALCVIEMAIWFEYGQDIWDDIFYLAVGTLGALTM